MDNPSRFIETYWSRDVSYTGDIVLVNPDGLWFMQGRADDVIKVAGHRIGAAEVEAAVASHPAVAEAVAVGRPDELKGEAIVVCIVVKDGYKADSVTAEEIIKRVEWSIGRFARPQEVRIVAELQRLGQAS